MSIMKWTYKDNIKGVALKNGDSFKKGDTIPIQVYRLYTSSRGGGSSEQTVYYYGNEPTLKRIENVMAMPSSQKLFLKGDFDKVEELLPANTEAPTISVSNSDYLYVVLAVAGYFAYKKFKN